MKVKVRTIVIGVPGTVTKGLVSGGLRNERARGDPPNYSIVEIGQNTKKSRGDLRRVAVTQTLVKDHQLTLVSQTLKGEGSRGTAELLYIDKHILNESKNRRKNLAMAWIDNKKLYLRRTRKLPETKLNRRNLIKGINTWAVPLVRY